jgi:GTP-binding protein
MNNKTALPSLAIVGRVNVGKSTLFNRLCAEHKAIVSAVPGTTRDRAYGSVIWRGQMFVAVDTAGIDVPERDLRAPVERQIDIALANADAIAFVVDVRAGSPSTADRALAKKLHSGKKPVFLVINKCDSPMLRLEAESGKWRQLGFENVFAVSAANGTGTGDLLDAVHMAFKKAKKKMPLALEEPATRLTFLGQPNVGKSSIINAMLGEERVVVSEFAGTTREPVDTFVLFDKHPFLLVDTVGIQRKAKHSLEEMGVKRTLEAIKISDVIMLVLDASKPPTAQDKRLVGEILSSGKGAAIIINKWDLIEDKETDTMKEYKEMTKAVFPFLPWAPIIFVSAKTGARIPLLYERALKIMEERRKEIAFDELEKFIKTIQTTRTKGMGVAHPKTYRFEQVGTEPPEFLLVAKGKLSIPDSYTNYLEKRLRERYGFVGTPVRMMTKKV